MKDTASMMNDEGEDTQKRSLMLLMLAQLQYTIANILTSHNKLKCSLSSLQYINVYIGARSNNH